METKAKDVPSSSVTDKCHGVPHDYLLPKTNMAYENMARDQREESSQCLMSLNDSYSEPYEEPKDKNLVTRNDSSYLVPVTDKS